MPRAKTRQTQPNDKSMIRLFIFIFKKNLVFHTPRFRSLYYTIGDGLCCRWALDLTLGKLGVGTRVGTRARKVVGFRLWPRAEQEKKSFPSTTTAATTTAPATTARGAGDNGTVEIDCRIRRARGGAWPRANPNKSRRHCLCSAWDWIKDWILHFRYKLYSLSLQLEFGLRINPMQFRKYFLSKSPFLGVWMHTPWSN
jgi:hypothetical protein